MINNLFNFFIWFFILFAIYLIVFSGTKLEEIFRFEISKKPVLQTPAKISQPPKVSVSEPPEKKSEVKISEVKKEETKPQIIPPKGFSLEQLSPYYQKVKITNLNRRGYGQIKASLTLSVSGVTSSVKVTDWYINTNRGRLLVIPKGIADYHPYFPLKPAPIFLNNGDYLNLYAAYNPTNWPDFNFRLNKCIGFLSNQFNFYPSLPSYCPKLYDRDELITLSGRCQSFLLSLVGSCRMPSPNEINQFSLESGCRRILDRINYGTCYEKYHRDSDFFSKEWRAWLKPGEGFNYFNLDPQHDRLLLFDENNLLVDEYIY